VIDYDLLRGLHLIAVIAWMAGLLYLPRLYAYHVPAIAGGELDAALQRQERGLLRIIMNPAMIAAWIFGLLLIHARSAAVLAEPWMIVKLAGVVLLTSWHMFLAAARKRFERGERPRTEKFWRMTNELPFLAAIVMVLAVTTEFGG
jgi:putative membrane protein